MSSSRDNYELPFVFISLVAVVIIVIFVILSLLVIHRDVQHSWLYSF